jgi:UDP-galactopyranose mutase
MKRFLIVGAGMTGCTLARVLAEAGHKVEIIEKEKTLGGLCYDTKDKKIKIDKIEIIMPYGLWIQEYGPHIFHTSNTTVWDFVNRFGTFNTYQHKVIGIYKGKYYNIPPNKTTIKALSSISGLKSLTDEERVKEVIFRGYSEKMWGMPLESIPESILSRIKIRKSNKTNYFDDLFQGVPVLGYTELLKNMINHKNIKISYNVEADKNIFNYTDSFDNIFYAGNLNDIQDIIFPYRYLYFMNVRASKIENRTYATTNFLDAKDILTRTTDIQLLYDKDAEETYTCYEHPSGGPTTDIINLSRSGNKRANMKMKIKIKNEMGTPCYPIPTNDNIKLFDIIKSKMPDNVVLCGRLGKYKYLNMDIAIEEALELGDQFK